MTGKLKIMPLGGLGEVGKNMTLIEYGRNIIVIDAGMMFPESDMLGVDYIIPDWDYLRDKKDLCAPSSSLTDIWTTSAPCLTFCRSSRHRYTLRA
jgi:mRNA degradation ribonuclease J1/J2